MVAETPLSDLIKRLFAELLAQGRFTLVETEEDRSKAYASATYSSDHSLLRFSQHEGDWQMDLAPRSAPGGRTDWISAGLLFNFLTQAPVDMERALQERPSQPVEEELRQWADRFCPIGAQAIAFFDASGFQERLRAFQAFRQKQGDEAGRQLAARRARHRAG